jgi:hypothetical protein
VFQEVPFCRIIILFFFPPAQVNTIQKTEPADRTSAKIFYYKRSKTLQDNYMTYKVQLKTQYYHTTLESLFKISKYIVLSHSDMNDLSNATPLYQHQGLFN